MQYKMCFFVFVFVFAKMMIMQCKRCVIVFVLVFVKMMIMHCKKCVYVIGMLMACPHTSEGQVSEKDQPHPIPHLAITLINDNITNHNLIEIMETVVITRLSNLCGFWKETWDDRRDDINKDGVSDGGDWDKTAFANCHFGQLFLQSVVADNIFANLCSSHLFLEIELMDIFLATRCCQGC